MLLTVLVSIQKAKLGNFWRLLEAKNRGVSAERSATGIDFLKHVSRFDIFWSDNENERDNKRDNERDSQIFLVTCRNSWNIKRKYCRTDSTHAYPLIYSIFYISLDQEIKKKRRKNVLPKNVFSVS